MGTKVCAGLTITALHHWPGASGIRSYLGQPHMHDFDIRVEAPVTESDRQIEFHDLRDDLRRSIRLILTLMVIDVAEGVNSFGTMSCEQIGLEVLRLMNQVDTVSVYEDKFCGAVVQREVDDNSLKRPYPDPIIWPMTYLVPQTKGKPVTRIITICGSTRFKEATEKVAQMLADEGWIVLMVEFFGHAEGLTYGEGIKTRLDMLHHDKIRHSDAIYVVNPGGYIGESTKMEIELARFLGKTIYWLVEPDV